MNGSLIPANTKRSTLILGMFRLWPDVVIAACGTAATIAALFVASSFDAPTWVMILCLLPMLVCVALVLPIPNYHNLLCAIQSIIGFYQGRKKFIWRGWCVKNEFKETSKK